MPLIYLIAGEQSGDVLGARLMRAIKAQRLDITFTGVGGDAMAAEGLNSLFPIRSLALMGFAEILPKLFELRTLLQRTVADIRARAPDIVVSATEEPVTSRSVGTEGRFRSMTVAMPPATVRRESGSGPTTCPGLA